MTPPPADVAGFADITDFAGPPLESEVGLGALTLGGFLREVAERFTTREAVAFHEAGQVLRWSYRDLEAQARNVARALLASGTGKGSRIALLMGNRPEWVATAYGVALAGGVLVPLNTFFAPPELAYVLRHSDAALLVTQQRLLDHAWLAELVELCPELAAAPPGALHSARFPYLRRVVAHGPSGRLSGEHGPTTSPAEPPPPAVETWEEFLARGSTISDDLLDSAAAEVDPCDDAVVVYTSGTTARPKGVLHAHRSPAIQSWRFAQHLRLDPTTRSWSAFPFFWTAGYCMVMGATLAAGGCLVLQEHFEPGEALRLLEAERVTAPHAWPHQSAAIEDHPAWATTDLSSLRQVDVVSSFARHPTVDVADSWSPRAAYGLTETSTIISSFPSDTPAARLAGNHGPILPGNVVRIVHPATGAPLPAGAEGEIAIKGPTLMKGYVKTSPESCFDGDGFFRSGDAGYVTEEGLLVWTGRSSDLIKTGGANVSPVEVETALLEHPGLKAAAVIGIPDPVAGEIVVVCAVPHDGRPLAEEDVRGFLRGRVASYKIPRRVIFVTEDELSLTGTAKVRTQALRTLAAARLAKDAAAPAGEAAAPADARPAQARPADAPAQG